MFHMEHFSSLSVALQGAARALVHDIHPPRRSGLNVVLLKKLLDPPAQLAAYAVLLVGTRLHQHQVLGLAISHAVNAWYLYVADNVVGKSRVMAYLVTDLLQERNNAVAGLAVRDRHAQGELRPVARRVRDQLDLAVGNDVHGAVVIAQHGAA